jgi:putative membrane protein
MRRDESNCSAGYLAARRRSSCGEMVAFPGAVRRTELRVRTLADSKAINARFASIATEAHAGSTRRYRSSPWPAAHGVSMEAMLRHWLLQTVAMMITALLIPRMRITSIFGAFGIVVALAFVNATLWSAALFSAIPDSPTVQALVLVLTNGAIFWILCKLLPGIEIGGILPAIVAPIVFTFVSVLAARYAADVDWSEVGRSAADAVTRLRAWLEESKAAQ